LPFYQNRETEITFKQNKEHEMNYTKSMDSSTDLS